MQRLALSFIALLVLALGLLFQSRSAPLPFPTPGQQDLIVLTQPGALTYDDSDPENIAGLEHDLVEMFAKELGVGVRYEVRGPTRFSDEFKARRIHLLAGWTSPGDLPEATSSPAFMMSLDVLIQHEASLPIDEESELAGRTVHVIRGSRQAAAAKAVQQRVPTLILIEHAGMFPATLLEAVASGRYELAVVDEAFYAVALQFAPDLQATLELAPAQPIAWSFPPDTNPELIAKANEFLQRIQKDSAFDRLKDRYFGHIRRLDNEDIAKLLERSKTLLPKLQAYFQAAQIDTGFDWRLLAALAYQESQWDANATSPTGVRGVMMLTEDTADHLKVQNRLDPEESIRAGARYLNFLREQLPESVPEPDRTWEALAAYNIGPGHFNAARTIGKQQKADVDSWLEMKRVLPQLAKPEIYQRLKSGRARGGEAVILVENIRGFYDVLSRQEPPYRVPGTVGEHKGTSDNPASPPANNTTPGLKAGKRAAGLKAE